MILGKAFTLFMHEAIMETALWPMAVDYATYHHNHMPDPHTGMHSSMDLVLKTQTSWSHFTDMHVWGYLSSVLEPALQDGYKLLKWKPHSQCGLFLGFSFLLAIPCFFHSS